MGSSEEVDAGRITSNIVLADVSNEGNEKMFLS